jgi:hypothetical protein
MTVVKMPDGTDVSFPDEMPAQASRGRNCFQAGCFQAGCFQVQKSGDRTDSDNEKESKK